MMPLPKTPKRLAVSIFPHLTLRFILLVLSDTKFDPPYVLNLMYYISNVTLVILDPRR